MTVRTRTTIMNQDENMKDSRYEEALERAKQGLPIEEVFPELKESEDERIRKAIGLILIATEEDQDAFYRTHNLTRKECTAWLEKQKDFQFGYPGIYFYDGEKLHFQGNPAMEERQKEQKYYTYEQSKQAAEDCYYDKGYNTEDDGRCNEQSFLWGFEEGVDWCEQQKERKPAEWSEEEKKKIVELKTFIAQCNGFNKENRKKAFDMIDSIRPRPHWKPSEEQMAVLEIACKYEGVFTQGQLSMLLDLKEQLKKL